MPLSPAAIGAGGDLLGTVANAVFTGMGNRAQRKWNERMYDRQFQDNIRFWNMQNEYNAPQQQMNRYKEAGLNPNLIYGSGSQAGTASPINTPDVQPYQHRNPDVGSGISGALSKLAHYQDFQIKQAQLDIMKQQGNNIALDNMSKEFNNQILGLEYSDKSKMLPTRQAAEIARLDQIRANTSFTVNQQDLNTIKNATDVKTALSQLLSMEQQRSKTDSEIKQIQQATVNLANDAELKNIDMELRRIGVMPGSPAWLNMVATFFNMLMQR